MTEDMLMHRIRAHRSAPDIYDPPTFEDMARRIEALQTAATDYKPDPDLPAQLERLALKAETSKTYVQEFRMMRAEGVADIIYEALAEIRHHRGIEG